MQKTLNIFPTLHPPKIYTLQYKSINTFKSNYFMADIFKISLVLLLYFFGIGGLWIMNDVTGCLNLQITHNLTNSVCGVTNGFLFTDKIKAFHLGLWTVEIVLFLSTLFLIYYATKD